jgi:hypothetical protein
MAYTEKQIKEDLKKHIDKEGSVFSNWYVGITDNCKRRLGEHSVPTGKGEAWWICREAEDDETARKIEKYFIDLGCDGGDGGGDDDSKIVYAYKKTNKTNP